MKWPWQKRENKLTLRLNRIQTKVDEILGRKTEVSPKVFELLENIYIFGGDEIFSKVVQAAQKTAGEKTPTLQQYEAANEQCKADRKMGEQQRIDYVNDIELDAADDSGGENKWRKNSISSPSSKAVMGK